MKTIVIYRSKTGFTEKYAQLISKALSCRCLEYKAAKNIDLTSYDYVIYGGSLYASGILGLKKMLSQMNFNLNKELFIFAVGTTPPSDGLVATLTEHNLSPELQKHAKLFYMRGGFNYNKLNFFDKFLMNIMKKTIQKKPESERTADERGMLAAFDRPLDVSNERFIEPLISYYKEVTHHDE